MEIIMVAIPILMAMALFFFLAGIFQKAKEETERAYHLLGVACIILFLVVALMWLSTITIPTGLSTITIPIEPLDGIIIR